MANNQAEKPRHEKDYDTLKKEYKAIQKTKDTMQLHHLDIATNAFKKHLMDDSGELDYSKLKVKDNQKNVIDEMTKGYDKVLADYYKSNLADMPKQRKEYMRASLLGINNSFLNNYVEQYRDNFTIDFYTSNVIDKHLERVVQTLLPTAYSHINTDDAVELLKLAKLDDRFDPKLIEKLKDPTKKSALGQLLYTNHASKGKFKDEVYQELGLAPYLKVDKD